MTQYAATTSVSTASSKTEIERILTRYGATSFIYGTENGRSIIAFQMRERRFQFTLALPDRSAHEFTHAGNRHTPRAKLVADKVYEQAIRQRWRALALIIKAKLEAVATGIVTFEEEFLSATVLPSGQTVGNWIERPLSSALENGDMPPMLPGGDRRG
jgi:hypothetical protein